MWVAAARQGFGLEQLPPEAESWPTGSGQLGYFDNRDGIGSVKRPLFYTHRATRVKLPFRGSPVEVEPGKRIGVCAHITSCSFGTTRRKRRFWQDLIEDFTLPPHVWAMYGATPEAAAERMALHQRMWAHPYHWAGMLNGDVLYNNGEERYTYAGNGSNRWHVQVAAEGRQPGLERNRKRKRYHDMTEHRILTWRATLTTAVVHGRERGDPIEELTAHRRYSRMRQADPGEGWWREVGLPMAERLNLSVVYSDDNAFGGFDMCREWDGEGLVDYWGRPLGRKK